MSETVQFCPRCRTKTWHLNGVCEWSDGHRWRKEAPQRWEMKDDGKLFSEEPAADYSGSIKRFEE